MAVSKRTRFEIFKRDGFRCTYCGATPLTTTLTVKFHADHVEPKSKGGKDHPENLTTACEDCNLGKGAVPLEERKFSAGFATEAQKEQAEQLREYLKVQRELAGAKRDAEAMVIEHWESRMGDWHPSLANNIAGPLGEFGMSRLLEAIDAVARRDIRRPVEQVKYFCGILRSWRNGGGQAVEPTPVEKSPAVREAEWAVAINIYRHYCAYRTGKDPSDDIDKEFKALLGTNAEGEAAISFHGLFKLIDTVTIADDGESSGNAFLDMFRTFIADKDSRAFAVKRIRVIDEAASVAEHNDLVRSMRFSALVEVWIAYFGTTPTEFVKATLSDMATSFYLKPIADTMRRQQAWVAGLDADAQARKMRRFWVDSGDRAPDWSPVREWPEWKAADEGDRNEDEAESA